MILAATELGDLARWIPLLPLLGAVLTGLLGPRLLRSSSHWLVIFGVGGALICSLMLLGDVQTIGHGDPEAFNRTFTVYSWIMPAAGLSFDVNFRIDPLTAVMLVTVCAVSLLVVIYSRDYMRAQGQPERGYERFFAFLGLFVFSMCTLVLAGNFLLLYLGWELVGLCSYLLIGFYYQRPAAAAAAKKAFLVNRIGDFGFGLGILFLYLWISPHVTDGRSPLDYAVVFEQIKAGVLSENQCTAIALLLFCGAVGKSAQLPLYVWLPDAMEGPSPVSALIHAATMVTAGVYMVVRCGPIFVESPLAMAVVASVGAATALFAATIALVQYDMKRILAYSTISQLGYMFLGVGVFAADSAIFHLFTHAFFKALLFLGAGSVMHAMGGVIDVRKFGGLRRVLPVTCATFVIGSLALAGFPLLSGFFSKDEIIHAAFEQHMVLGLIGLVTAVLTAFYTFRMVFMAFAGKERIPEGVHAHESGRWMLTPLVLLAIGAIGAGYFGVHKVQSGGFAGIIEPHGGFHHFLEPVVEPFARAKDPHQQVVGAVDTHGPVAEAGEPASGDHTLMYVSGALAIFGILAAYGLYVRRPTVPAAIRDRVPQLFDVLHNKYYVDEINDATIVKPLRRTGDLMFGTDRFVVDGLVWAVTAVPRAAGMLFRGLQTGAMQGYGVTMTAGMIVIVLIVWLTR